MRETTHQQDMRRNDRSDDRHTARRDDLRGDRSNNRHDHRDSAHGADHGNNHNADRNAGSSSRDRKRVSSAVAFATIKRLWGYMLQYKVRLIVVLLAVVVSAAAQAAAALFLQSLVDRYILPLVGKPNPQWQPLITALSFMAALYAVGVVSGWLWNWVILNVAHGVLQHIRDDMFAHQQQLAISYFDTHEHGDVMSRYTNDTDTLREAISQSFPNMIASLLASVASLLSIFWLSVPLGVFVVLFTVGLFMLMGVVLGRSGKYFMRQQQAIAAINSFAEEAMNGLRVIKVFNHEARMLADFEQRNEQLYHASRLANTYGSIVMPLMINMGYLLYVLLAILGALMGIIGVPNVGFMGVAPLSLGTVIALLTLSRAYINPLGQISMQANVVMMAVAGASRIFTFLDEPVEPNNGTVSLVRVALGEDGRTMRELTSEELTQDAHKVRGVREMQDARDGAHTQAGIGEQASGGRQAEHWAWKRTAQDTENQTLRRASQLEGKAREVALQAQEQAITSPDGRYTLLRGDVRFTNVTFGYDPAKSVLHDITWFARPGQKIALVGATGAGKTTITNLINRFYDIQAGQILYDGIDVRQINKVDLRQSLGVVLQDVNLFTGTVMDNIRFGKLDATDEECIAAAKLTNADGFIRMLPQGYQTQLESDGGSLSQGQRQLISIARAAVADPPAMILDEATSSIDTRTEEVVQRGMDALMRGRTVFVIAHRLSTVRNADVIMVLDHGRIIERGTHEELLRQRGEYYQLYTGALELE